MKKQNKKSAKMSEKDKDKIVNKIKSKIPVESDSAIKIPDSVKPNTKTVKEIPVDSTINQVVPIVVNLIKEDMNIAINSKFEEMKNIIMVELKDIRAKLPVEEIAGSTGEVAHQPNQNQVRGLPSRNSTPIQQTPDKPAFDIASLVQLLPLIKESGILGGGQPKQEGIGDMIQNMVMKKFVADIGRSDNQNELVTNYLLKKMLKADPTILDGMSSAKIGNGGNENTL